MNKTCDDPQMKTCLLGRSSSNDHAEKDHYPEVIAVSANRLPSMRSAPSPTQPGPSYKEEEKGGGSGLARDPPRKNTSDAVVSIRHSNTV
uniref:Uncharacterized protein n=1 Tax=Gasterosteus aculeatus TaxID=69293 RepID=G3Q534_GASAC